MGEKPRSAKKPKAPAKKTAKAGRSVAGARPMAIKSKKTIAVKSKPAGIISDSKKTENAKRGRGRPAGPVVWTPEYTAEVIGLVEDYIAMTDYPSVADFCFKHRIRKQRLYESDDIAEVREWLLAKKETKLEEMGRTLIQSHGGRGAFVIFALKQLGWTDKTEVDTNLHTDEGLTLVLNGVQTQDPRP